MQAYTEILPPTAVTHAVSLPFIDAKSANLVAAKTSLLQVFEIENLSSPNDQNGSGHGDAQATQSISKLVLIGEYPLSGTITSIAAIKTLKTKSGGHSLLVSLKDARISLLEWDPEFHSVSTVSIHYYEGEDLQTSPWAPELGQCSSFLSVDPSNRCAALKFGQRHLAILPFHQAGDDLVMEDDDDDVNTSLSEHKAGAVVNGTSEATKTPYGSSFVLPLTALDPALVHPIDLAFLHEYREPSLGVLSSAKNPTASGAQDRTDIVTYTVFTLDIEQRARTPLLSVTGLPSDLFKLVPLPLPIGGALLIGGNEIIHIDQAGKSHAIGVNEFAKQSSSFSMADHSQLNLKLEHCIVQQLNPNSPTLSLFLASGELALLDFALDGRFVSELQIELVPAKQGGQLLGAPASCATSLGPDTIFVGSEQSSSVLLKCRHNFVTSTKKRSHADMLDIDQEALSDEDMEDEDDLYADDATKQKGNGLAATASISAEDVTFSLEDRLLNLAASGRPCLGVTKSRTAITTNSPPLESTILDDLQLTLSTGSAKSGSLAFMSRQLRPTGVRAANVENVSAMWPMTLKKTRHANADDQFHNFLVVSETSSDGTKSSGVYDIRESGIELREKNEFEIDIVTENAGTLCEGTRMIQISGSEVRCYDSELAVSQLLPMVNEDTDEELQIVHTSFCDPFLLVVRDDLSAVILNADDKSELDELEAGDVFKTTKWTSGSIYKADVPDSPIYAYMLTRDGGLHIYELLNLSRPIYCADTLSQLSGILTSDRANRRPGAKDALEEILVTDLGFESHSSIHLLTRSSNNDINIYRPHHFPTTKDTDPFEKNLRWHKSSFYPASVELDNDGMDIDNNRKPAALKVINKLGKYKAVFAATPSPRLIIKERTSIAKALPIESEDVQTFAAFCTRQDLEGYAFIDSQGRMNLASMDNDVQYGFGWAVEELPIGQEADHLCYHTDSDLYVLGVNEQEGFTLPDDESHQESVKEEIKLVPQVDRGVLKLFNRTTKSIIAQYPLEDNESLMCMECLELEVSEFTHERRLLIAAGTAIIHGEDLASKGRMYIFEVITVVPELDRPETNRSLKCIAKEEVRGAVTALSEIGRQGFVLMAQGQKCLVRGLKEDCSLLPVAFMDVQSYVSVLKSLKGTGMALIGDVVKGIWFAGFEQEPYKMHLFGKSSSRLAVLAAEFLPQDKQLFIMVADDVNNLHVLEFNPDNPKSLSGQRLLHKSSFHTGHFPISMTLLRASDESALAPEADGDGEPSSPVHQILLTHASGALALVTPLSEPTYRRLSALQTQLTNVLEHAGSLNPRGYRSPSGETASHVGAGAGESLGTRGVLDGNILRRWGELSVQRRREAWARMGVEGAGDVGGEAEVRRELAWVCGAGLGLL